MISAETYNHDYELAYKQGWDDAVDEFANKLMEELSQTTLLKDGYHLANIIKPLAERLKESE